MKKNKKYSMVKMIYSSSKILFIVFLLARNSSGFEILFSPEGGIQQRIISEIQKANTSIDIAIYKFTEMPLAQALVAAHKKGVQIRLLLDADKSRGTFSKYRFLEESGVQTIKLIEGINGGKLHHKFAIIDGKLALSGSYNWTGHAERRNFEDCAFST